MTRFIEERRGRFQVELMCRTLGASPSTYYAARRRPPSARAISDAALTEEIQRIFEENYAVYGVRKVWHQLCREGVAIGKDRVWRLMREAGLRGARRGKPKFTTKPDPAAPRPPDLVERNFSRCPDTSVRTRYPCLESAPAPMRHLCRRRPNTDPLASFEN